ncbi:MAG: hypothetical protein Q7S59_01540, partial [Sulfurimonas sp.]|nr:hypothetical protein [Sulfurimonas sp.]
IDIQNKLNDFKKMEAEHEKRQMEQMLERNHYEYQMIEHIRESNRKANKLHNNIEIIAQEIKKREVSQVTNTTNISFGDVKDSNINTIVGDKNHVNNQFDKNFNELIQAINSSNIQDKEIIIQDLQNNKNDDKSFKKSLGTVLTKGAEFGSIVSAVSGLLSL